MENMRGAGRRQREEGRAGVRAEGPAAASLGHRRPGTGQPPTGEGRFRSADFQSALDTPAINPSVTNPNMAQRSDAQSRSETGAPAEVPNNFGRHGPEADPGNLSDHSRGLSGQIRVNPTMENMRGAGRRQREEGRAGVRAEGPAAASPGHRRPGTGQPPTGEGRERAAAVASPRASKLSFRNPPTMVNIFGEFFCPTE